MKPHVLIVDDSITVRMDLKDAFESAGFTVTLCATLAAARQASRERACDVAILDVLLPDGDGLELLQEWKDSAVSAALPVLLLSAEDEVRDRVRGLKTGADDYVGKPYDAGQLVARARELVRRRQTKPRSTPSVVVIDDSPTFAAVIRHAIETVGYEVTVGSSGEEGLRLVANLRPDAVVVDQVLPRMDGVEVIRQIRADAALRRVPCLLLTASAKREDEIRALEAGADAFIHKETDVVVILAKLATLVRENPGPAEAAALPSLLAPKRVLAVDDSPTYLSELALELRGEGYDVVAARSGAEALELLGRQPVDGILLDLVMPEMSGEEVCRRIKHTPDWRDIPLLMLTARDESAAMIRAINAGADDYITKLDGFDIVKARLRAQLRRRQFEAESRTIREQNHRREMAAVEMEALRELSTTRAELIASLEQKNHELSVANEELRRAKEAADAANRELESFSYSVSHDLRAPLRHVNSFSQLLREHRKHSLDEKEQLYLEQIRRSTTQMNQLIDDMLSLARVTRQELKHDRVDLSALAHEIVAQLRLGAPAREVEVQIADGLIIEGDRGLCRILLENLLNNAWKFTGKCARARIEFGCQRVAPPSPEGEPADEIEAFYVRDNGAGFDMKYTRRLFGVFQRLHSADDFAGTGVGLATVLRVVRRHRGRVWADAAVGRGATFFFTLAAEPQPGERTANATPAPVPALAGTADA